MKRIVLAYSGGLVTSAAIAWLAQERDAEVVTVTLDFGQERELAVVRERALALGAVRAHVIDVREEFVRDFVLPALQADALEGAFDSPELSARSGQAFDAPELSARSGQAFDAPELSARSGQAFDSPELSARSGQAFDSPELSARSGQARPTPGHPMVIALARPLIARRLVEMAKMESASAVAHGGAPGTPGENSLHEAIVLRDPALEVIAPAREWGMSSDELLAFARARNIHVPPPDSYRTDATLWGRILTSLDAQAVPEDAFTLTRPAEDCQDEGAVVDIDFKAGVPVRANGVEMSLMEMIESLETIAGAHGVGRIAAGSYVVEAPAAVVLHAAHRELEALVVGADLAKMKTELAKVYANAVLSGRWFSDLREALAAFTRVVQPRVTGSVRVSLAAGRCEVTERSSVHEVRPSATAVTATADPKVVA